MHSIFLNMLLQTIESLIAFDFYESIKTSRKKVINLSIIECSYIIMCIINLAFNYNVIVNTVVLTIFQFLFAYFIYKLKPVYSVLYSILFTCIVTITELSALEIVAIITNGNTRDFIENTYSYIIALVISKTLLFITLKIITLIIKKFHNKEKVPFSMLIYPFSLLLVLTVFGVVVFHSVLSDNIRLLLTVSSLVLIVAVIVTCFIQQKQSQKDEELLELKAFQQEQEINNTYFELLEHQNEELQVFVHDTKKHYRTLYDLAEQPDQLKEYIQGIVTDIEETNQIGKTANKLLDLIISKYDYICSKKQILFEKNIHQSNLGFIGDSDLTSIFNNLFDNAIEAAENSKNKFIFFGLNKVGNMIVIDITNSCDNPPVVKNQKLITTKDDKGLHGYGFKSICRTVKKYNGDIEWEYKKELNEFVVSIIFPIEEHVER